MHGGLTGLVRGTDCAGDELILSLERMDRIEEIAAQADKDSQAPDVRIVGLVAHVLKGPAAADPLLALGLL